jgi:hypothetical protein
MASAQLDNLRFDALTRVATLGHLPILTQQRTVLLFFHARCVMVISHESSALE